MIFVASSSEPLPSLFKLCLSKLASPFRSHVLLVEVLHPVNSVNITHVTADLSNLNWTLRGTMLSYTFINSHSQVSDPGPEGPLV